ncbi:hypothetical protein RFI_05679 [Reticulomyxa filosa]|uniref:Uncharacterized protein n=1 Tax=Reticulomyxa filosa TaxID=46433 RepID=X6MU34_RETFI|nr:hypothetical protein RFI_20142 [Reticulomyxa filosa]ETO31441.1 hypothetical protein RFI_05679 [Reticulomyxa filosa]|eukprot:ETO17186.1 hypothetical protein RFI_20142 [Reticulomyxa filosa]
MAENTEESTEQKLEEKENNVSEQKEVKQGLQQFIGRIQMSKDPIKYYTGNFAMSGEVKVDEKLVMNAVQEKIKSENVTKDEILGTSGLVTVNFENEQYTFQFVRNSTSGDNEVEYTLCLRCHGTTDDVETMLNHIHEHHINELGDVNTNDVNSIMGFWSKILTPYASAVQIVDQKQEKLEINK